MLLKTEGSSKCVHVQVYVCKTENEAYNVKNFTFILNPNPNTNSCEVIKSVSVAGNAETILGKLGIKRKFNSDKNPVHRGANTHLCIFQSQDNGMDGLHSSHSSESILIIFLNHTIYLVMSC